MLIQLWIHRIFRVTGLAVFVPVNAFKSISQGFAFPSEKVLEVALDIRMVLEDGFLLAQVTVEIIKSGGHLRGRELIATVDVFVIKSIGGPELVLLFAHSVKFSAKIKVVVGPW